VKDTVFDTNMQVVFHGLPHEVERRLEAKYPSTWTYVLPGETKKVVTVSEYVNRERFEAILDVVEGVLERQSTRPYKGVARRLYAQRVTKQIVDLI
jgi:hypothetical protein